MPRLTVTISDEHEQILERQADGGEAYRSKSEVIRECIEAHERVEELSDQLACLEAEVELLRDQRATLKEKAARVDELESQLRQLQTAYHRAISEGKSPQELEPMAEQTVDSGPSAEALIEEAESTAQETNETTVEPSQPEAIEAADPVESSTVSEPVDTKTVGSADPATTDASETTADSSTQNSQRRTPSTAANTAGATDASGQSESATDGGVEIDEELLYQSPSVGSRLKSALFGGPGGSR